MPNVVPSVAPKNFWSKVNKNGPIPPHRPELGRCWEWVAGKSNDGRGNCTVRRVQLKVHRISYTLHFGSIPDGLCVCHHCDNPPCVNPSHLFVGTHGDNARDRSSKGRDGSKKYPDRMRRFGVVNGSSKLSFEAVQMIRRKYSEGTTRAALAREYKVWPNAIQGILDNKTWVNDLDYLKGEHYQSLTQ